MDAAAATARSRSDHGRSPVRGRVLASLVGLALIIGLTTACDLSAVLLGGQVTAGPSGARAAGVAVSLYAADDETLVAQTVTNPVGEYKFRSSGLDDGTYRLRFEDGWWPDAGSWAEADDLTLSAAAATTVDHVMSQTGTLSGTVVDGSGEPIEMVAVAVLHETLDEVVAVVLTAEDGTFSVGVLEAGLHRVRLLDLTAPHPENMVGGDSPILFEVVDADVSIGTIDLTTGLPYVAPVHQAFDYVLGDAVSDGVPGPGAGVIETPGSSDVYTFAGTEGQEVYFDWTPGSFAGSTWSLTGPGGVVVFGVTGGDRQVVLPATGSYELRVAAVLGLTGTYGFVTNDPLHQAFDYVLGDVVSNGVPGPGAGNLESSGSSDTYTFAGVAGQEVYFRWAAGSFSGSNWTLTGPGGVVVFGVTGGDRQVVLPTTGTYELRVAASLGLTGTYGFTTSFPSHQSFAYVLGDAVSNGVPGPGAGNLESSGSSDVYTFAGVAGQEVYFRWASGSFSGSNWTLTGPGGVVVFGVTGGDRQVVLPDTGSYELRVAASLGLNRPGFVGGSRPLKRGWSHADRGPFGEAERASLQRGGEGTCGAGGSPAAQGARC